MSYQSEAYEVAAASVIRKFEKRGIDACYCPTKEEARDKILSMMEPGSSISWGGSESMEQAGVMDAIKKGDYELIDRKAGKTPEESREIYGRSVCADYFLMSTNAFTRDGELVNIDGAGNRVACLAYGPKTVIILAGMQKLCENTEAAFQRIRTQACPPNARRVGIETPCVKNGLCGDCLTSESICCQILVTRMSRVPGRIKVVLTGDPLGF